MIERGFYIIKDEFFKEMNDPYLKGNKEANRPHYYCFKEEKTGLFWMIPLSSKIDKYKKIMNNKLENSKPCDIIHIIKLDNGKESAFLIQDMFPITEKYIEREYTIANNQLKLTSEHSAIEIEKKARKIMNMLKKGIKFTPTQPNINLIKEKLMQTKSFIKPIKIAELIEEIQMLTEGMSTVYNKETGEFIHYLNEYILNLEDKGLENILKEAEEWEKETYRILDEILNTDNNNDNKYIYLPSNHDRNDAQIMQEYIEELEDEELKNKLQNCMHRKGMYRNFKNILAEYNLLDKYYNFYNIKLKALAIDWCEMNCLKYEETSDKI